MIDWNTLLYDPLYASFGTAATMTPAVGAAAAVTVIDQTRGVEIQSGIEMPVIRPACFVRKSEMTGAGLTEQAMLGGTIAMNGYTWTVNDIRPKPGPMGKDSGESMFVLVAMTAGSA